MTEFLRHRWAQPDPKPKAHRYKPYLEWLRKLRCVITRQYGHNNDPVIASHQRQLSGGGTGLKPSDFHALPTLDSAHRAGHHDGVVLSPRQAAYDCLIHEIIYIKEHGSVFQMMQVNDLIGGYIVDEKL